MPARLAIDSVDGFSSDDIQTPTLSLWLWEEDSVRIGGIEENIRDLLSDGGQTSQLFSPSCRQG